jgi:hypothetical protein
VLLALAVLGATSTGRAGAPSVIDMQEHLLGASNTNAVAGHGGLTAGVSADGDLSVLSWPGPSFADQLNYVSSNDLAVRDLPHLGADDGMGSYLGLLVTTAAGTSLVWLRDASAFSHTQRYTQPDAPVPETTFTSASLGLTVVLTDIVSPDVDLLTRRLVVTRGAGSPVTGAKLVLYENLSPTLSEIPMLPLADWALDAHNDFAAAYDAAAGQVVHFHPSDRGVLRSLTDALALPGEVDYGPIEALMKKTPTDAEVDALLASIDTAFPPGVAAIVTTRPVPEAFQVGGDATPLCAKIDAIADNVQALPAAFPGFKLPIDPSTLNAVRCTDPLPAIQMKHGFTWAPEDALSDLADGALSGSRLAAVQTNAALVAPLTFNGDTAEGEALFAFGPSVAKARAALAQGTQASAAARQAASEKAAHDALGKALLPDASLGPRVSAVALRALVNVYVARDRGVGAIVASVSRQPPYHLDWPRDGSFFQQGLDVAGLLPWVTQRATWYSGLARADATAGNPLLSPDVTVDPDTGSKQFPAHAWEMNYFADGNAGGPIRFEIDNTALHVWATVSHAAALQGKERSDFVAAVWPGLKSGLDLLERWKDPETGLPWPANEDDHFELTSTLHGATAVYAALVAGARLAHEAKDEAEAKALVARANELKAATLKAYYDPKSGLFRDVPQTGTDYIPGTTGSGATAWVAWPARLLDAGDPRLEAQLAADLDTVMKDIRGETEGGAYVMKNVISAALLGEDGGSRATARDAVTRLADIATADTMHFGEVFITTHPTGAPGPVFSARVAPPHVWEGMLFYLSAMALSSPERFNPEITALPLPAAAPHPVVPEGGCHCRSGQRDPGGGGLPGAVSCAALLLAGARRAGRRARR